MVFHYDTPGIDSGLVNTSCGYKSIYDEGYGSANPYECDIQRIDSIYYRIGGCNSRNIHVPLLRDMATLFIEIE